MRALLLAAIALLAGSASAFSLFGYGDSDEPWNVCAGGHCNCKEGILTAMSDGLDCSYRDIPVLADHMVIPAKYTKVDFSGNNISVVSPNTFYKNSTNVRRLMFAANTLSVLEDGSFGSLTSLEHLDLGNNLISNMSVNSLSGLTKLKSLDLSYNHLTSLPEGLFITVPNIATIILDFNPIHTMPDNVFHGLLNLRKLHLSGLKFSTIHEDLFAGLGLEDLALAHNQLTAVPTAALYQVASSLKSIDLSGNPVKVLPSYAFYELPRLSSVKLEQMTRLTSIESFAFWDLPSLRTVVLRYLPKITFLDDQAFTTTGNTSQEVTRCPVQDFTLSYTILTSLPEPLLDWENVKFFNLHNNRWRCDCEFAWIKDSPVERKIGHHFYCSSPPRVRGSQLDWMTKEDFECRPEDVSHSLQWGVVGALLVAGTLMSLLTVAVLFYRRQGYLFRPPRNYDQLTNTTSVDSITVYDVAPQPPATSVQRQIDDATA